MRGARRLKERQVTSLAVKAGQNKATCKSDIQRKAHESSLLVHELNELRVQKKTQQMNVRTLQKKLETLSRALLPACQGRRAVVAFQGRGSSLAQEDKNRLENLRVTQDITRSTMDAQKAENKMLRDKLSEVLKDGKPSSAGASSAAVRTGETLQAAATTLPATVSRVGANLTCKKRVL
eukprot:TRINITY_DN35496_c0_g1_i3.p3 TRINITY_DN35496_c0_g1~~TRINITY_DN35496_c0_g1_i3.p3  ORF type:complete len:179 (-),score=55.79 TRINITY_DN35496_c0_g1_i3:118-654(-)